MSFDREADALFLRLDCPRFVASENPTPGGVLDFDERRRVGGIEILRLSSRTPALELDQVQLQAM